MLPFDNGLGVSNSCRSCTLEVSICVPGTVSLREVMENIRIEQGFFEKKE
jgi:hypothetical protein